MGTFFAAQQPNIADHFGVSYGGGVGGGVGMGRSMGMTNSYKIAIEEGANIVRIGTKIFGERDYGER